MKANKKGFKVVAPAVARAGEQSWSSPLRIVIESLVEDLDTMCLCSSPIFFFHRQRIRPLQMPRSRGRPLQNRGY